MDINTLYPEEKHYQRWHRLTSFLLVCVFVLQATLPTVAIAAQLLNDQQIEAELSGTLQFQRAASHDNVLYRKIEYVEQPSSGMYGLKAFHDKLKDQYPHLLPAPQIIPLINSGLTVIIPFHSPGKPVGDNYVQSRLVRSQIFSLLGKQLINEETHGHNETTQIRRLYENALKFALLKKKKYGDVLDGSDHGFDMVWPEYRVIRGERVVVPVVYLTKATTDNNKVDAHVVQFTGNRVTWKDIEVNGQKLLLGRNTILESMNDLVNVGGEISSSGNLNLHVHGTLVNASGALKAVDNVSILANNVEHKTLVHRYSDQSSTGFYLTEYLDSPATILAQNGNIRLRTHGDIRVRGASFLAPNGSIKLQAYGDISVEAIALNSGREAQEGKNYYRLTSVGIVQSELSAQDAIKLMAQGKVTLNATKISSDQGAIEILAQQGVYIVDEQSQYQSHRKTKYSRVSQEIRQFQTVAIRSALEAGKDVVIASEYGDVTLRAAKIKSQGGTRISANNGKVNFLLTKEQDHYFKHRVQKSLFRIKTETIQDEVETAAYNEIVGGVKVHATHGLTLELGQYEGESLTQTLDKFASNSELSWMGQLYNDPRFSNNLDIVYKELHELHIHKKTSNLSPAAMAIIAIAVSVAMGPAGAGWVGGEGAIVGAFEGAVAGHAMSAAATTLATQAATGLASGKGIGGTLESMLQEDSIRSLATSMATAGVLNSDALKDLNFFNNAEVGSGFFASQEAINIAQQATQAVIDSAVSAGIETLISGRSLGTLGNTFVSALKAQAINEIGKGITSNIEQSNLSEAFKYIAHAATGCLLANVKSTTGGNSQECAAAAAGAVAAKYVASQYDPKIDELTAQGEQAAQWLNKHINIDATQMSQEEIYYYLNTHQVSPAELAQWTSMQQAMSELNDIQVAGADISRLMAGLSAFVAKGTANAISSAANNGSNIAQGAAFREMSLEYKRATVLLGVLERHHILQSARMTSFSVEELLKDGIKLPSAFSHAALANKVLTGGQAALLHEIAIMEILTSGSPIEKAKLVEEYGDLITNTFSQFDDQILNFDWKGFGEDAAIRGAVTVFMDMRSFMNEPRMNNAQGIEQLRSILNHRWNRYLDSEELVRALENFGSASLYNKIATSQLKSSLRRGSRELVLEKLIKQHKKKFVDDLQERTRYLLDVADKATPAPKPLYKKRVAIAKAVVPGRPHSATGEFFNFGGNPAAIPKIIENSEGAIIKSADGQSLYIKNADDYLRFIERNFYKGDEFLEPRLKVEIKAYLDYAQANNLPIPHGGAGAPALHAEVRAVNAILKENPGISFSQISIATFRMRGPDAGNAFPACQNCTGILTRFDILTGTTN